MKSKPIINSFIIYAKAFRLACGEILEYRLSFIVRNLRYPLSVWLMYYIWKVVAQTTGQDVGDLTTYFHLSALVFSWSNMHTWYVEEDIKYGYINRLLIRPIHPFLYYCSYQFASTLTSVLTQAVFVMLVAIWLHPQISHNLIAWLLAFVFFGLTYLFTFTFLYTLSLLSVWLTEVFALRWVYLNLMRFITGLFIPFVFFPVWLQKLLFFSPFPHLASTPIQLIQGTLTPLLALPALGILVFWVIVIYFIYKIVWRKALISYEGSGG